MSHTGVALRLNMPSKLPEAGLLGRKCAKRTNEAYCMYSVTGGLFSIAYEGLFRQSTACIKHTVPTSHAQSTYHMSK